MKRTEKHAAMTRDEAKRCSLNPGSTGRWAFSKAVDLASRGVFMARAFLVLTVIFLAAIPSAAADNPLNRGMQLYSKHLYAEAGNTLYAYLPAASQTELGRTRLGLGMTCLASARLYRELYRASLRAQMDYLGSLVTSKEPNGSRYASLYLGRAALESGKLVEAASLFNKCVRDQAVRPEDRALARVYLGECLHGQGKIKEAARLWSGLNLRDPEVRSGLAGTYSRLGLEEKKPVAMGEEALAAARQSKRGPSLRVIANLIELYAREGQFEKGFALVGQADLSAFSCEEIVDAHKVIRFYDPSLLGALSLLYATASLEYLEKAATDTQVTHAAHYYLGAAHAGFGSPVTSNRMLDLVLTTGEVPGEYRAKAAVLRAANRRRQGDQKQMQEMQTELERLAGPTAEAPVIAEVLSACTALAVECPDMEKRAAVLAGTGERASLADLYRALGGYYIQRRDYARAISSLEAGRDKSNKNSIVHNDPLMLVILAGAYYKMRQYSEALEIYFEMSKHFPAVRQIQVAVQGVYAREQKSAGDARLF
jgi:tetratricopeptide (TPR) repeat protein